jgi:AcrR family transcriptional regulator
LLGEQSPLIEAVEELSSRSPEATLRERLVLLAETVLDNRRLSLLWQREARHLNEEEFRLIRDRTKLLAGDYKRLLLTPVRVDLDAEALELRTWAVASILSSPAYFDLTITRPRLVTELADAAERVILSPSCAASVPPPEPDAARHSPGSRREQLISAAARAFRRNGYGGASIDEIGREVGVVGPALYRYFDNKAGILVAAVTRFSEWRALENLRAMNAEPRPERVIGRIVDRYVCLAAESPDLLALGLTERIFLPTEVRDRLDQVDSENLAEWQRWLIEARPELDAQRAAVIVQVTKTAIDDCVRTPRLYANPRFQPELSALAHATLGI